MTVLTPARLAPLLIAVLAVACSAPRPVIDVTVEKSDFYEHEPIVARVRMSNPGGSAIEFDRLHVTTVVLVDSTGKEYGYPQRGNDAGTWAGGMEYGRNPVLPAHTQWQWLVSDFWGDVVVWQYGTYPPGKYTLKAGVMYRPKGASASHWHFTEDDTEMLYTCDIVIHPAPEPDKKHLDDLLRDRKRCLAEIKQDSGYSSLVSWQCERRHDSLFALLKNDDTVSATMRIWDVRYECNNYGMPFPGKRINHLLILYSRAIARTQSAAMKIWLTQKVFETIGFYYYPRLPLFARLLEENRDNDFGEWLWDLLYGKQRSGKRMVIEPDE